MQWTFNASERICTHKTLRMTVWIFFLFASLRFDFSCASSVLCDFSTFFALLSCEKNRYVSSVARPRYIIIFTFTRIRKKQKKKQQKQQQRRRQRYHNSLDFALFIYSPFIGFIPLLKHFYSGTNHSVRMCDKYS